MAIIAYLRVSTDEQARSGLGLDAQLAAIEQAAGTPDAIYRDEGISGSSPKRPGLHAALHALADGDTLVVAKRDRLARDTFLSAWIEKEAKRRGARILSAAGEGTDNDDPASVLMRSIVDAFAEYERNLIAARTSAALAEKRKRGEKTGGPAPLGQRIAIRGYRQAPGGPVPIKVLEEDPESAEVVAIIAELHQRGYSLRQIAAELEARGVPTQTGKTNWQPRVIARILKRAA